MSKRYSLSLKLISAITIIAFLPTQACASYLRAPEPTESPEVHASLTGEMNSQPNSPDVALGPGMPTARKQSQGGFALIPRLGKVRENNNTISEHEFIRLMHSHNQGIITSLYQQYPQKVVAYLVSAIDSLPQGAVEKDLVGLFEAAFYYKINPQAIVDALAELCRHEQTKTNAYRVLICLYSKALYSDDYLNDCLLGLRRSNAEFVDGIARQYFADEADKILSGLNELGQYQDTLTHIKEVVTPVQHAWLKRISRRITRFSNVLIYPWLWASKKISGISFRRKDQVNLVGKTEAAYLCQRLGLADLSERMQIYSVGKFEAMKIAAYKDETLYFAINPTIGDFEKNIQKARWWHILPYYLWSAPSFGLKFGTISALTGLFNDGGTYTILHSLLKFMFMDFNGAINGIQEVIGQIREHWWLGISHVLWISSTWGVYVESREEVFYAGDFGKYYNEERTRIKSYFDGKLFMRYQQELNFPRRRSFDEPLPQADAANYITLLLKSYLCQDKPDKDANLWKIFEDIYGLRSWELGWPNPQDEVCRKIERSYRDGEITDEAKRRIIDEKWFELQQRLHQILVQRGQEEFILAELQASPPQQPFRLPSNMIENNSEQSTRQATVTSTSAEASGYTKRENGVKLTMAVGVAVAHNLMIEYGLAVMRKEKDEAEKAAQAFLTYLFAEGVANDCIVAEVSKIEIPQNTYAIAASEIDYVRNDLAEKLLRTNKFDGVFQTRNQQETEAMKANLPENSITLIFNRDTNKLLLFGPSIVVIDMDRDMAVALQNCLAIVTNV